MPMVASDAELDNLVVEHLSALSEVLDLTKHFENSLSSGRVLLAKTRHNTPGNGSSVSSTSYNLSEMSTRGAVTRVNVCQQVTSPSDEPLENNSTSAAQSVRMELVDGLSEINLHKDPSVDPVRWFAGVLVPTSLRQSQACFRRAIHLAVDLANRRAKLEFSSRRLGALIKARLADKTLSTKPSELATTTMLD
ncbi:unnamed protein product [Calicophoron daubneyi]|uniref:Vacuolar ATPase assembly protein VMA22 n=1 Tax=Calicophoron daubneyi TaxID=300641 RepID=A0AAV2TD14_CALDB